MHFISLRGKGREGSAMLLSTNWPLNCYRLVLFSFCFREGRGAKRNTLYTNVIGISKAATSVIFETAKVDLNYITRFLFENYFDVLNIYDVNDVLAVFTPHTFVYFSALGTRHLGQRERAQRHGTGSYVSRYLLAHEFSSSAHLLIFLFDIFVMTT